MGVEYRGQLCIGYNYDQMLQIVEEFGSGGDYADLGFEMFSPYYDADKEDSIFGYSIARSGVYDYRSVDDSKLAEITIRKQMLYHKFLITPQTYIMAEGY
jgi:hypothetical protein